jgi:hypothetical protein
MNAPIERRPLFRAAEPPVPLLDDDEFPSLGRLTLMFIAARVAAQAIERARASAASRQAPPANSHEPHPQRNSRRGRESWAG